MLAHLAAALADGWALWFAGAALVGGLLMARDEWRLRRRDGE